MHGVVISAGNGGVIGVTAQQITTNDYNLEEMDIVEITDEQGNVIKFKRYNGLAFSIVTLGNVRDELDKIARFQRRPDDVILCSFPKSGTHWVYNMVEMLRTGTFQYKGTPAILGVQDLREINAMQYPRTLMTHMPYRFMPNEAKNGKVKIVHVLRNPKDTVTSFYEYNDRMTNTGYKGNFDGFLHFFLTEGCKRMIYYFCNGSYFHLKA